MKKFMAVFLVVSLLMVFAVMGVGAAGALNEYEQAIINKLSETITKNGAKYSIPVEYVNQAKAYFLKVDVTKAQSDEILGYIESGKQLIENNMISGQTFKLSNLPADVKAQILELGQKATNVVGLNLVYTADKQVKITDASTGEVVFNNTPIIKTTGVAADFTPAIISLSAIVLLVASAFAVSKKASLFAK